MPYVLIIPKDALWKEVIVVMIDDFFRFFFPEKAAEIDFSKGFRFLEQELFKLFPELEGDAHNRRVDKLIEVTLKSGEVQWILVHVEVQGYKDEEFTKRMFEYFYRILEMYGMPITALAIFTDDNKDFHPKEHRLSLWGTEMVYRYNTYKLLEKTLDDFADTSNPFAIVMETAWHNLKQNRPNDKKLETLKIQLIRRFLALNYSKERIRKVLRFIGYYTNFEDKKLMANFFENLSPIVKKNDMTVDEIIVQQIKEQMEVHLRKELADEITEQVTEQITEQVTEQITEQVTEQITKQNVSNTILKLQKNGFSNEQISTILEIPLDEILRLIEK